MARCYRDDCRTKSGRPCVQDRRRAFAEPRVAGTGTLLVDHRELPVPATAIYAASTGKFRHVAAYCAVERRLCDHVWPPLGTNDCSNRLECSPDSCSNMLKTGRRPLGGLAACRTESYGGRVIWHRATHDMQPMISGRLPDDVGTNCKSRVHSSYFAVARAATFQVWSVRFFKVAYRTIMRHIAQSHINQRLPRVGQISSMLLFW